MRELKRREQEREDEERRKQEEAAAAEAARLAKATPVSSPVETSERYKLFKIKILKKIIKIVNCILFLDKKINKNKLIFTFLNCFGLKNYFLF